MKKSKIFFLFLIVATLILGIGVTALAKVSINRPSLWDEGGSCKHSKTETEITSAATCTKTGTSVTKCKLCGRTLKNNILKKKAHSYTKWKYNISQHWKVCSVCGTSDSSSKASHDFPTGKCVCGMAEPKCTTDKLLLSHLTDWAYDFRNKTAETHDVITTCTKCKVSASSKKVKHYFGDGIPYQNSCNCKTQCRTSFSGCVQNVIRDGAKST